jgi:hypothetical protein
LPEKTIMEFLDQLGQIINGPKALTLSGLTFAIVDNLKRLLKLQGASVQWFALFVAALLCAATLYFREGPPLVGKALIKEMVTLGATAFAAVFIFGKGRDVLTRKGAKPEQPAEESEGEPEPPTGQPEPPGPGGIVINLPDRFKDSPAVEFLTAPKDKEK